MFNSLRLFISSIIIFAALFSLTLTDVSAKDITLHQLLRVKSGSTHKKIAQRVVRGTSHVYHLQAIKGQNLSVQLETAGKNTSFRIYSARNGQIAQGVPQWSGNIPENGEYVIEVITTSSAEYTLTVGIE